MQGFKYSDFSLISSLFNQIGKCLEISSLLNFSDDFMIDSDLFQTFLVNLTYITVNGLVLTEEC